MNIKDAYFYSINKKRFDSHFGNINNAFKILSKNWGWNNGLRSSNHYCLDHVNK